MITNVVFDCRYLVLTDINRNFLWLEHNCQQKPPLCRDLASGAFITNEVALEVSVGLLGFDYQKVVQTTNQVEHSEMEQSGANFKLNIFSIGFGLSFYIPTGDHRMKKSGN